MTDAMQLKFPSPVSARLEGHRANDSIVLWRPLDVVGKRVNARKLLLASTKLLYVIMLLNNLDGCVGVEGTGRSAWLPSVAKAHVR